MATLKKVETKYTIHFGDTASFVVNEWLYNYFNVVKNNKTEREKLYNILTGIVGKTDISVCYGFLQKVWRKEIKEANKNKYTAKETEHLDNAIAVKTVSKLLRSIYD